MRTTPSPAAFIPLSREEELDALVLQSHESPALIFKHSPTCGTSAQAYDQLESYLSDAAPVPVHLVNVLSSRALSSAIAARFGIRHESPQLLLVAGGKVQWNASHFRVTVDGITRALSALETSHPG
jgi:bacillithiol system protein YtxJ